VTAGLPCPCCGERPALTVDSRAAPRLGTVVRRRRACRNCGHRWTTYELPAHEFEALLRDRVLLERVGAVLRKLKN